MKRPEGYEWIGPTPLPSEVAREFRSVCVRNRLDQCDVLRWLIEGFLAKPPKGWDEKVLALTKEKK